MDETDNKTIIHRFIEEIGNTGDVSNISEFISEDYVEVYEGKRYPIGIKGAIDNIISVRKAYPDLKLTIENQISEGEWVAAIFSITGTFKDEWFGLKPTGKTITYTGVNIYRIIDGKIVEHGSAANLLDPLLRAGVITRKK